MSETNEILTVLQSLDKKIDVHIARQAQICEASKCVQHTHDVVLFGDGSNPNHGLVGSHHEVKIKVDGLVKAVWGTLALVLTAVAMLIWNHVTEASQTQQHRQTQYSEQSSKTAETQRPFPFNMN